MVNSPTDSASNQLATLILDILEGGDSPQLAAEPSLQRQIVQAVQRYIQFYSHRYAQLSLLGLHNPIALTKIYVPSQLIDERTIRYFESPKTLKQLYRQRKSRDRDRRNQGLCPGLEVANQKQYLLVLGEPGYGKSTFLKALGLEALQGSQGGYRRQCFPILLPLRNCKAQNLDLLQALVEPLTSCGFPQADRILLSALSQGRILLLLDGLDEVSPPNRDGIQDTIQSFVDRYPKNRFVISCRKAAGYRGLRRFATTEVAAPSPTEVATLLRHQLPLFIGQSSNLIEDLKALVVGLNLPWMRDLQHTPLFLMVLCWVYSYSQRIPSNSSAVYREAMDLLLESSDAQPDLSPSIISLKADVEKALLAELAFQGLSTQMILYDSATLLHWIREFLEETVGLSVVPSPEQVLDYFCRQHFLMKTEDGDYCFAHRIFQEYFTAHHLAQYDSQLAFLLQDRVTDLYWREVFLLLAGQVDCADRLLLLMETAAQNCLNTERLQQLLGWTRMVTVNAGHTLTPPAKRVAALAIALDRGLDVTRNLKTDGAIDYALNLDLDLVLVLDEPLALDLDRVIALDLDVDHPPLLNLDDALNLVMSLRRLQIFEDSRIALLISKLKRLRPLVANLGDSQAQKDLAQGILQGWLEALDLPLDWITLTEAEAIALQNYLYVILLMEECKRVAVRVSRSVWNSIEDRLLTL
ncbi:NACHT domain-containing protein [Prochlorothrix hollandica]|uniref:NACHT domain-containing protein n=1 Tax=Prochlorothrix hollandica TaxID=1223 RepID=UPI00333FAFDA